MKRQQKKKSSKRKSEFAWDKPKECKKCYFWNKLKRSCSLGGLDNCYYRIVPPKQSESSCEGCPYGKIRPCIGYCTVQILKNEKNKQKGGQVNG